MSNFSVGKSSSSKEIKFSSGRTSNFTRLKTKYKEFKTQAGQSDFANAPVLMQKELDMLMELRDFAEKEKLSGEVKSIEEKIAQVREKLTNAKINDITTAYYAPINIKGASSVFTEEQNERLLRLLDSCKNSDGLLDPNAEKLLSSFKGKETDLFHIERVLNKCRNKDGSIDADKAEAVAKLALNGVSPSSITEYIDRFSSYDESLHKDCIDFDLISEVTGLISDGLDIVDAEKFAQYLQGDFSDKTSVRTSLLRLHKADIDTDRILDIANVLSVKNPVSGKLEISPRAVSSVVSLKKTMAATRANETNERKNSINLLGVNVFQFGDMTMVSKNGKFTYVTPVEGENYEVTKERYNALVSSIEDNMLSEFAQKYKDEKGEIDNKYLRVALFLRNAGIVYNNVFNLLDSCINEDGSIDANRLDALKTIRKSGALSDDVASLLDACKKDADGNYSQTDIENICDLSSCIVGGKEVCSLLPVVRDNDDIKDCLMICAPCFSDKQKLLDIPMLLKTPAGEFGENETEMFYDLAFNYFADEENIGSESEFLKAASEIIQISRSQDGTVSDDATGVCAIMCKKNESMESVKSGLTACYDANSNVDGKLAQILWDMYLQDANLPEATGMIAVCKMQDGSINYDKADMIISLLESNYSKEKVAQLVQSQN